MEIEKELYEKIISGTELTEAERKEFLWDFGEEVEDKDIDVGDWITLVCSVRKFNDKYFAMNWARGNTECQENEFYYDPKEVFPMERAIVVTDWLTKDEFESANKA